MRGSEVIGNLEIHRIRAHERERIQILPTVLPAQLEDAHIILLDDTIAAAGLFGLRLEKRYGMDRTLSPKPDVSQPGVPIQIHLQYHVCARQNSTGTRGPHSSFEG